MAAKAKEAVTSGSLTIDPKIFEKEWFKWLDNSRYYIFDFIKL